MTERPLYIVNVEAAIFHEGRYLMLVRGEGEAHAPGTLSFPGGKVERADDGDDVLERTLRREVFEEVGLEVGEVTYLESKSFVADDGEVVVDVVFLCAYISGEPCAVNAEEAAEVRWLSAADILAHPRTLPWIRQSVERAERVVHLKTWLPPK